MLTQTDKVKLIFGLKIKQLRAENGISTYQLAEKTGLSPSYINEIEKGKKYPKQERIFDIAKALNTDYDSLVSLKLSKKLEAINVLLNSDILNELPLHFFGIDFADLLELMSGTPTKLGAFINTVIQIGRNHDFRLSDFYTSVLRTYQEMHLNYFEDLENEASDFLKEQNASLDSDWLKQFLETKYKYQIVYFDEKSHALFASLRSIFVPKTKTLWLNSRFTNLQQTFTLAREVGYQVLNIKERPLESSVVDASSFEQVLNNFRASYFAGAILIPQKQLIADLTELFEQTTWQSDRFMSIMGRYPVTGEVFFQRIINILTSHFKLNQLFFIRFNHHTDINKFFISREMHLGKLHSPHATILHEHFCRRWVSVRILKDLETKQQQNHWEQTPLCEAQISEDSLSKNQYFMISVAKPSPPHSQNSSINLGFEINAKSKNTLKFLNDSALSHRIVGETCERCTVQHCQERAAQPEIITQKTQKKSLKKAIADFING